MSDTENVVKLPDQLEQHIKAINIALAKRDDGICDWIEANIEISVRLYKARAMFPNNIDFGAWCDRGFGNCLPKNIRAIYIQWGEKPEWTRLVLEKTDRTSIEMIHRTEWSVTSARFTPPQLPQLPHHLLRLREKQRKKLFAPIKSNTASTLASSKPQKKLGSRASSLSQLSPQSLPKIVSRPPRNLSLLERKTCTSMLNSGYSLKN